MVWAALGAGARAMAARGAGAAATRKAATQAAVGRSGPGRAALMREAARPARPMGQGPLPPPKPSQYNYTTRTGVMPAQSARMQRVQSTVQRTMPQVAQAVQQQQQSRSNIARRNYGGSQGQRYWQGSGTEVVGGMPTNYDRMSIAGPRTMGIPSFGRGWQEGLSQRIQAGVEGAAQTHALAQAERPRTSIVPYSDRVASMPNQWGPPRTPGRGMLPAPMSPLYQPGTVRQPSGIKGGPLFRGGSDTPVSQGSSIIRPAGTSDRGAQPGISQMFGSGSLYNENVGTMIEGNPWNANTPGTTMPTVGANDAANARAARSRKAGANPVSIYKTTLGWPEKE